MTKLDQLIKDLTADFNVTALNEIADAAQTRYDIIRKRGGRLARHDREAMDALYMLSVYAARVARIAKEGEV